MKHDITLAEAIPLLAKPVAYVHAVLMRMHECANSHDNAYVRLGTVGGGRYPSFRIVYLVGENEEVFGSYIDSGTSFPKGYDRVKPGDWSTSRNGLHEVLAVETNLQAAKN